jgi:peptide/nickel transport system substrate-binding protein
MTKKIALYGFFTLMLLVPPAIKASAKNDAPSGGQAVSASNQPKRGGILVFLDSVNHTNLYPPIGHYANNGIMNQIADRLTWQNPETQEIEPWLAESWEINQDATQYTFKLRPGVTFSDGTPLDAAVVAKNYDSFGLGNKDLKHPVSEVINNYERSEVIDPLTVRFHFKRPSPGFLQGTAASNSGIVALSTISRPLEQFGSAVNIIGSGPFVISGETLGKEINLKAREDYNWAPKNFSHQGRAYLDGIKWVITPESSIRIGALGTRQADFIRDFHAFNEKEIENRQGIIYAPQTNGVNTTLNIRPDNPLVADVRVRRALLHGTNTREIIDTLYSPSYGLPTSILAKSAAGYVDVSGGLAHDPQKAAALLDEAGWRPGPDGIRAKDGEKLILTVYESLTQPQCKEMLQLIAQQWRPLGIQLNILAGDSGSRTVDELDPIKTPLAVGNLGRADPDAIKSNFHPENRNRLLQIGGSSKQVKSFTDPKLNTLLENIASEPNREKRLALTAEAQRYIVDQAYALPTFESPNVFAGNSYVKGALFDTTGRQVFYNIWLDK